MAVELNAWTRSATGKGAARKLRSEGRVPAVVYGVKPQPLVVEAQDCSRLVNEGALGRLLYLRLQDVDETKIVLFKDMQVHPIRGDIMHVDFHEVALDEEITTRVSIVIEGEEDRVADEGVFAVHLWEVEVSCLANQIPDNIVIDVSGMVIGDNLLVQDLEAPEGVNILTGPDEVVAAVVAPADIVEEEEEEEDLEVDEAAEEGEEDEEGVDEE